MQVKQWVIRPVSHERSVYILITNVRRLNSRLHPCSFVAALKTLLACKVGSLAKVVRQLAQPKAL